MLLRGEGFFLLHEFGLGFPARFSSFLFDGRKMDVERAG